MERTSCSVPFAFCLYQHDQMKREIFLTTPYISSTHTKSARPRFSFSLPTSLDHPAEEFHIWKYKNHTWTFIVDFKGNYCFTLYGGTFLYLVTVAILDLGLHNDSAIYLRHKSWKPECVYAANEKVTGACDWLFRRKCTCWWIIVCSNLAA